MDSILTSFLNFGIGGSITAAFLYFCYHILTKTIPGMLEQHEKDIARREALHREDMNRLEERYERRDDAYLKILTTLCERVEKINDSFSSLQGNLVRGNCPALANAVAAPSVPNTAITLSPTVKSKLNPST